MQILRTTVFLLLLISAISASGFGSNGPISAAFVDDGFFCAIDASGKQEVICWNKNNNTPSSSSNTITTAASSALTSLSSLISASQVPPMVALSGGEGFLCGILANTSEAFCWSLLASGTDLVPSDYKTTAYSHITSGKSHVGGIRGAYYSDHGSEYLVLKNGPRSRYSGFAAVELPATAAITLSCVVRCWGDSDSFSDPPIGFNFSSVPKHSGFMALASSDFATRGIREDDLVLEIWSRNTTLQPDYSPPLELCSPGLCRSTLCLEREFAFNASNLNESDLTSLCVRKDLQICPPCSSNCFADATNGFKEFNELGRGSYGFVYKVVLSDGRQVAVKRANAATIIHTNIREFEMELEILCNVRHCNIVNLLGYCSKGTRYLHKEVVPPIIHRNLKASNILLDSNWGAEIADFGLVTSIERDLDLNGDMKSGVYNFGIVLLEILSGRKAYDKDLQLQA
ncbi:Detected protein of unknown function [Hibiscus syriacus]|uniref:Protein kinase domain-containing protein n=1 Tax=Hibiscus syriacus TaxID=106335 RepID=A0A6A3D139_HIBSY|nr:Detected protein of unknown function [Hibiscus syriacus]